MEQLYVILACAVNGRYAKRVDRHKQKNQDVLPKTSYAWRNGVFNYLRSHDRGVHTRFTAMTRDSVKRIYAELLVREMRDLIAVSIFSYELKNNNNVQYRTESVTSIKSCSPCDLSRAKIKRSVLRTILYLLWNIRHCLLTHICVIFIFHPISVIFLKRTISYKTVYFVLW